MLDLWSWCMHGTAVISPTRFPQQPGTWHVLTPVSSHHGLLCYKSRRYFAILAEAWGATNVAAVVCGLPSEISAILAFPQHWSWPWPDPARLQTGVPTLRCPRTPGGAWTWRRRPRATGRSLCSAHTWPCGSNPAVGHTQLTSQDRQGQATVVRKVIPGLFLGHIRGCCVGVQPCTAASWAGGRGGEGEG